MGTIVGYAVGNALLPGIGGPLLGALGGYIDSNVLFPQPDQKGPRLDGLKLQSGIEGSPMNIVLGTERVAGTAIWKGPLIEKEEEEGKGGPSSTTYSYSVDLAVLICKGTTYRIREIYANGSLLYNADADVNMTSNQVAVAKTIVQDWNNSLDALLPHVYMDLSSPAGGPDLSRLKSGKNAVLSGFSNPGNNGTFRVVSSSIDPISGNSTARLNNMNCVVASSGATVTIFQDLPEFSPNKMSAAPTFYLGSQTQPADPLIQSYKGAAATPAYRGRTYVVLHRLQLQDYGNSIPQLSFVVERVNGTMTIAEAISVLLAETPRPPEDFDVSGVTGNLRGMVVRGAQSVAQSLAPILLAYDLSTQEDAGVLRFFNRVNAARFAIDTNEIGAREPGSDAPRPFDCTPVPRTELPVMVTVTYVDPSSNEQPGTQAYRARRGSASSDNILRVDLPVVLTAKEAQDAARRFLWTARGNQYRVRFALPPSKMLLQENDRIDVTAQGTEWSLLVSQLDCGVNGLLEGDSVTEEDDALTYTDSPAEDAAGVSQKVFTVPEMEVQIVDFAPLKTAHESTPGFYTAAAHLDSTVVFKGAALFVSDSDVTYTQGPEIAIEATMGRTTNAPSLAGVSGAYWDRKTVLNVAVFNGALDNRTEIDVLNGANRALWGREIIGFATATLQSDGTYNVSNIIHGLAGTDDMVSTHVAGETFVLLTGSGIQFHELSFSDIDRTRYVKAVAVGGIVSQFDAVQFKQECNTLRHFAPVNVRAVRDSGTNDIAISWTRRTRAVWRTLSTSAAPLLDTAEAYQVEIWNDAETLVLNTYPVSAATTFTYTSAMQTTDFGSPHANVHVRVYQIHSITGRSKAATAVL